MIHAGDRRDFDGRTGKEDFVSQVQFAAVDGALDNVEMQFVTGYFHHTVTSDTFKYILGAWRGDQFAAAYQEDVTGCAFGHVAGLGEEDGFVEAIAPGFVAGERAIDISAAEFGAAGDGIIFNAPPGYYAGVQSILAIEIIAEGYCDHRKCVAVVGI